MQTFLPFPSYEASASTLDYRRLGKQRVETLQILQAIEKNAGWINHPATKMWIGYESSLIRYGKAICTDWISRGYKDTCFEKISDMQSSFDYSDEDPWWLGIDEFHDSHKGMLYKKNSEFYSEFAPYFSSDMDYWWPTKQERPDLHGPNP